MKKFFVLFFSIALLMSCSEDDNAASDPILGTWYVAEVNNPPGDFTLSECNTSSFMTFNADGTTNSVFYTQVNGNCTAGPSTPSEWSQQSGIYTFTIPIPELEPFSPLFGTIQFNADTFTFTPTFSSGTSIVFKKG